MTPPANLFDPTLYQEVRRPYLEAMTLPPWCYTSSGFFRREVERIFLQTWNFIGREDELPDAGDYLVLEMFGESVIVVRSQSGNLNAFVNSCTHRGTRILEGKGHCRAMICPYHGWTFDHDGRLKGARGMEKTRNFALDQHGLTQVRLETWDGFLFINFDHDAECLSDHLGDITEKFATYNFGDMVCVRRKEYNLSCNWKIFMENAMEDYHTAVVHKSSIGLQDTVTEVTNGAWDSARMESSKSIAVLPEEITPFPHIEGLSGNPADCSYFTVIYPTTFFGTTHDCMWFMQELPLAADRTKLVVGSCFPRQTVARDDFEQVVEKYYHRWDKSIPEDNAISERQQAGLKSAFSKQGRLSSHEPLVHRIANWVLDRVLDEK